MLAISVIVAAPPAASAHGPGAHAADATGLPLVNLIAPQVTPVAGGPATTGEFSTPFAEPTVNGQQTAAKCVTGTPPNTNVGAGLICKPAAGTLVNLPNGKVLYWDALEGTENNKFSIVAEGGKTFTNDSSRLLDLGAGNASPSWTTPTPYDAGANPQGNPGEPLIPGGQTTETYNDGALFGSHESFLPDGRLLVQGGTDYSLDPGVNGLPFGVVELTGLQATRIYDPKTNAFTPTGDTAKRRWYPTLVETGAGKYLDFSGVTKLLKPIYPDHPQDSLTNVKQVESFDPATSKWTTLPSSANYDLPLYPRMHLLPDGHVFYNAAGQDFNPFGQSIGELNWVQLASFDPASAHWTQLGLANTSTPTAPAFRGSTSSTMLPLVPDAAGNYSKASFLTAGGVLGTSPGSYFPTPQSSITTVDTTGGHDAVTQQATGPLNQPRWFGQNVLLPTGEVVVFSGANVDEVVGPGTEMPIQQAEMFDPATNQWHPIAVQHNPRTYHNTAVLLPSGEVLVGGHATISTLYLNNTTIPGGFAPHDGRDPSFELFKPPYMFRGDRPVISGAPALTDYGQDLSIDVQGDAGQIKSVALVRNSAITHLVDADQRTVMLPVIARSGSRLTVRTPADPNVAPPGPYMLFVNRDGPQGLVPSVARQLTVGSPRSVAGSDAGRLGRAHCTSRRNVRVHVRRAYARKLLLLTVTVNGRRLVSTRKRSVRISLPRRAGRATTVRVRLKMRLRGGRTVTEVRVYRPCGPAKR
ncbi:MAG: hypothetical protein NVSMB51_00960 [Solirubrobacteraceae bacterium]